MDIKTSQIVNIKEESAAERRNVLTPSLQELKEELKGLGLPASGVKADLVKRLEEALTSSRTDEDMEPAAVEEKAKVCFRSIIRWNVFIVILELSSGDDLSVTVC
jgi:hypothetical protein